MKIKEIEVKNFKGFSRIKTSLDPNKTYVCGPNGSGKTTFALEIIQAGLQGIGLKSSNGTNPLIGERFRFIGKQGSTSDIIITLYDEKIKGEIKVETKITKTGSEIKATGPDGSKLDQAYLNDLFNLFMICPKEFIQLPGIEQARVLGINTAAYDQRLTDAKAKFTAINAVLTSMGAPVKPEQVEAVDFAELSAQKDEIIKFNQEQEERERNIKVAQTAVDQIQEQIMTWDEERAMLEEKIKEIQQKQQNAIGRKAQGQQYIENLPVSEEKKSLEEIETQIRDATDTNNKAATYKRWMEAAQKIADKKAELFENKKEQKAIEQERLEYIQGLKLPFNNLEVDEKGELLLDGKPIKEKHFSTGELMKIVPLLMARTNPPLKYVFIQDSNLMDDDKLEEVVKHLTEKGFQLMIEVRTNTDVPNENCIVLREQRIIEGEANNILEL